MTGPPGDRSVRVFVSSTFRDMGAERDELVKRVFPALRALAESRGATFTDVDLRWGVTEEQSRRGETLAICLDEIERCRPYFIGLLGERYGWVPGDPGGEVRSRADWGWVGEDPGASVTELEVLHGVLRDPAMAGHAFFYFRDEAETSRLAASDPSYAEPSPAGQVRLAALKARIRESGLPVAGFGGAVSLGERVLADLTSVIDARFPAGAAPDALGAEAALHEAFARDRALVHVGRETELAALDAWADSAGGAPLVVTGESGIGKSALLAAWSLARRESQPGTPLIAHFAGASPASADPRSMLRRLLGELRRLHGADAAGAADTPDDPAALRLAFAIALHMAAARGPLVLVIDALDRLDDLDGAPDLAFLPPSIPGGVRLLLSTTPGGRPSVAVATRGWPVLEPAPLGETGRAELIAAHLQRYRKTLEADLRDGLASAPQCASPLYLRVLLDELRVWGSHDTLAARLAHYLAAPGPAELYALVLERWEADYERDRPGLVRDAMAALWAARRGLSEPELLDLLGPGDGVPLPRAAWSPLGLAAAGSLADRGGLLAPGHAYLREAIETRYLPSEADRAAAHRRLAGWLTTRPAGPRRTDELPWQLRQAGEWDRLAALLSDLGFFADAWEQNQQDVRMSWVAVEAHSAYRVVEAYSMLVQDPERYSTRAQWSVATLLHMLGHAVEALAVWEQITAHRRAVGDRANVGASLANQGNIQYGLGNLDGAESLYRQQEVIGREVGDDQSLAVSLSSQARILADRGELPVAMKLHRESERLFRRVLDRDGVAKSLGGQGMVRRLGGDFDGAMDLFRQQEQISRELGDLAGVALSLGCQGTILTARGDLDGSMQLYRRQEEICRDLGDQDGIGAAICNEAIVLEMQGNLDEALVLLLELERICLELKDAAGLSKALGNRGNNARARGDIAGAMALYQEQGVICRRLGDGDGLAMSLGNQAVLFSALGELDFAMVLYRQQEEICRAISDREGLGIGLCNQARCLLLADKPEEALPKIEESIATARDLGLPELASREELLERIRQAIGEGGS